MISAPLALALIVVGILIVCVVGWLNNKDTILPEENMRYTMYQFYDKDGTYIEVSDRRGDVVKKFKGNGGRAFIDFNTWMESTEALEVLG